MGVYVGDNLVAGNVGEVYSKAQVDAMIANAVALAEPTGSIKPFAGTTIPDGYLLCDGSAVSRTTYAALFAVIGTTYGTGDGSTTFNLPDVDKYTLLYRNDAPIGDKWVGAVPNITGTFVHSIRPVYSPSDPTGCFTTTKSQYWTLSGGGGGGYDRTTSFNAESSSAVYNSSASSVHPRSINMYQIIKY